MMMARNYEANKAHITMDKGKGREKKEQGAGLRGEGKAQ